VAKLHVAIVTPEGQTLSQEADFVVARGADGELGVLPRHIPLLTPLRSGELLVRNDGHDQPFFVAGGVLEVLPDRVVVLADVAERAEDIDEAAAEEARRSAEEALAQEPTSPEAIASLEREVMRLRVAEVHRRRRERPPGAPPPE
jgi:F-type H+-transporting ATPase subunit epsilon